MNDSIVEEIRQYRREFAAKYDHDLEKICKALKQKEAESSRPVVHRGPRLLAKKTGS